MSRCNATLWSLQCAQQPSSPPLCSSVDRSGFECGFPIPTVVCTHYSCPVPSSINILCKLFRKLLYLIVIIPFVTIGISLFCCLVGDKNNDNYSECTRSMHKYAAWPVSPYLSKYYVLQTQCIQRQYKGISYFCNARRRRSVSRRHAVVPPPLLFGEIAFLVSLSLCIANSGCSGLFPFLSLLCGLIWAEICTEQYNKQQPPPWWFISVLQNNCRARPTSSRTDVAGGLKTTRCSWRNKGSI